ncbi:MAG: caspase family protein [Alistipes sp.]|nr:caspase family protein [Alistipes sp.]
MYEALYRSYEAYADLLRTSPETPMAAETKTALRNIRPYLQNGAIYYSQKGDKQQAVRLARAYVDIPLMEAFRGEHFIKDEYYPTMVYFAAAESYNARDYAAAVRYFREYLQSGAPDKRQEVYTYMSKSCVNIKNYSLAKQMLDEATTAYPSDFNLLSMAINVSIDSEDNAALQKYVSRALLFKPNDPTLLNIQGKLHEDTGDYQQAISIYTQLRDARPHSLEIAKHLALNYFNMGVLYSNKSLSVNDPQTASHYDTQSKEFFETAIPTIKDILTTDPNSTKFLEALAVSYQYTGRTDELGETNRKLASLGGRQITAASNPSLLSSSAAQPARPGEPTPGPAAMNSGPLYSQYAKQYVEARLKSWQAKDPYETIQEYRRRVSEQTRDAKVRELLAEAEANYIDLYAKDVRLTSMKLRPYDAENEVFLAESDYGELIVPVPRANNEARVFESTWNGMQFKNPKFRIDNDRLKLAGLTFVTPLGKAYRYDVKSTRDYTETTVDVRFDAIDYGQLANADPSVENKSQIRKNTVMVGASDVDENIPQTNAISEKTFAVIIANEKYEMVAGVPMALNDGKVFGLYCQQTLGLPQENIRLYENATYGSMLRAVRDIQNISDAYAGDIQVIFYYAGHGIPNETTKDAFLLPVDADGLQTEICYPLSRLYSELGRLNARSVFVFLDACFSGAKRDGGMLASARGVALKAKKEAPQGNMVIFSAASDDETAFPYEAKGHGLFTYYLLKKLQETAGNATLAELSDYVIEKVKQQSIVINRKAQTPVINPASAMQENWRELRMKP